MKYGKYILMAVALGVVMVVPAKPVGAVSAMDFDAGNIIDDAVFYNKDAMSLAQIEQFIIDHTPVCDTWGVKPVGSGRSINGVTVNPNTPRAEYAKMMRASGNTAYHDPPYACLNVYHENPVTKENSFTMGAVSFEGGISAAEIIYNAAQEYGLNPQVLLVTLRKEAGSLWSDDWPLARQFTHAMGYACPDTGPNGTANCDSTYNGFYNQMSRAAWQFDRYKNNITQYQYRPGQWSNIKYAPDSSCGTKSVYIENIATASLYIYTPYTPNDAALKAYPGEAPCGAYGNRNFFMMFNQWFGSTHSVEWIPLAEAKPLLMKADGYKYNPVKKEYDKSLKLLKGQEIWFASKTVLGDGEDCLRSSYDTLNKFGLCVMADDLVEEVVWGPMLSPRKMAVKEGAYLVDAFTRQKTDILLEAGEIGYYVSKITLPNGEACVRNESQDADDELYCVALSDLEDVKENTGGDAPNTNTGSAWVNMLSPRELVVIKKTNKISPINGGLDTLALTVGQAIRFKTKVDLSDGTACLRSEYDTINSNNLCVKMEYLREK